MIYTLPQEITCLVLENLLQNKKNKTDEKNLTLTCQIFYSLIKCLTVAVKINPSTTISFEHVAKLKSYKKLALLDISKNQLDNKIMEQIVLNLPLLSYIEFSNTNITNQDLMLLANLKKLEGVNLSGCSNINDLGIKNLTGLQKLTHLYISDTDISDKSINYLLKIPSLQSVSIYGTDITFAGYAKLVLESSTNLKSIVTTLSEDEYSLTNGCIKRALLTQLEIFGILIPEPDQLQQDLIARHLKLCISNKDFINSIKNLADFQTIKTITSAIHSGKFSLYDTKKTDEGLGVYLEHNFYKKDKELERN